MAKGGAKVALSSDHNAKKKGARGPYTKRKKKTETIVTTPKSKARKANEINKGLKETLPTLRDMSNPNNSGSNFMAMTTAPPPPPIKPFVKGEFIEDLTHMMFGFGDSMEPSNDSLELMEDIAVDYVRNMTKNAMDLAAMKGKLDTECFIFLIRKDREKYSKVKELLRANDELREAVNSGFDPSDEKMYV